jgi:hypothetical protein
VFAKAAFFGGSLSQYFGSAPHWGAEPPSVSACAVQPFLSCLTYSLVFVVLVAC